MIRSRLTVSCCSANWCSRSFTSDQAKANSVISLLRGAALAWAQPSNTDQHLSALGFELFVGRFSRIFDCPNHVGCVSDSLFSMRQGARSVAEYSVEFCTLSVESGWNEPDFQTAFRQGLSARRTRFRHPTCQPELAHRPRDQAGHLPATVTARVVAMPVPARVSVLRYLAWRARSQCSWAGPDSPHPSVADDSPRVLAFIAVRLSGLAKRREQER